MDPADFLLDHRGVPGKLDGDAGARGSLQVTYSYKLDGNTMSVTQLRNQNGPFANPVTVKAVRIE